MKKFFYLILVICLLAACATPPAATVIPPTSDFRFPGQVAADDEETVMLEIASGTSGVALNRITLSESDRTIVVGQVVTATLTLSEAAPQGGVIVSLQSSQPTSAGVPASVIVPQGSLTTNFLISGLAPTTGNGAVVTASVGTSQVVEGIVVNPAPPIQPWTLTLERETILVGRTLNATITLRTPAPAGGTVINISAGAAGGGQEASFISYPRSLTVPAGQSTATLQIGHSANITGVPRQFVISTYAPCAPAPCSSPYVTTNYYQVIATSEISRIVLPQTIFYSGGTVAGTIQLTDPVSTDTPVEVSVAPQTATVTGTAPNIPIVVIRNGQSSAGFSFVAPSVNREGEWAIVARFVGAPLNTGKNVRFTIKPITLSDFQIYPSTVTGNRNSTFVVRGTVTLVAPAPAGGITVAGLASGYSTALNSVVFSTLVIPAGQTNGTVEITVSGIIGDIDLPLRVTQQSTSNSLQRTLAVRFAETPPPTAAPRRATSPAIVATLNRVFPTIALAAPLTLASFTLSSNAVKSGDKVKITATLNGNVPQNETVVLTVAGVSANLNILGGQNSGSVTVAIPKVAAKTTVRLGATYGGVTKTADLTISP